MTLQTRSRSAATKDEESVASSSPKGEGESSESKSAEEHSAQGSAEQIARASPEERYKTSADDTQRGDNASSSTKSKSSSSRSWDERARTSYREREPARSAGSIQEHMFSPPPYKERFSRSQREQHSTMDHGERRDFDQLDLTEDLAGPEDPLFLRSFSDESPLRQPEGRQSPLAEAAPGSERKRPSSAHRIRRSPAGRPYSYQPSYGASYRSSPRGEGGSYQSTPSHGHPQYGQYPTASPRSGYGPSPRYRAGYSPYQHLHPEQWEGHPDRHAPYEEDDIPPPPPSSTKKRPPMEHPSSPRAEGTPEKGSKPRSPFRSPAASMSKQKFRRSPFFHPSPNIGTFGSFGMDTPSGTLAPAEFSPMGPAFTGFDQDAPMPLEGDIGTKFDITRTASQDSDTPILRRRREKDEPSPFSGIMGEWSPFDTSLHGIARSPVHHRYEDSSRDRPPPKGAAVTISGSRGESRVHSTPHGSVKKTLWPRSEEAPGPLRVEIGGSGASSTKKSLEGINSMMQARHSSRDGTPSGRSDPYSRAPPPHHPPHHGYRSDMTTPIKSSGHPYQRPTPTSSRYHAYPPGSAGKYPPSGQKGEYTGSAQKPMYAPPMASIPPPQGKENKKKPTPQKRSPCNCKKSKCLKLYCECFAAEKFCQGCNCADCGNTPTAGPARDKAIKDTRAKNPNAFKPRFAAKSKQGTSPQSGHNMGCRCKRSECLKKYCECFQAGVICGAKCKCADCLNYAGSQALIDKRRKIKDQRGADFAMRVADEAWKQGRGAAPRKGTPSSAVNSARRQGSKSTPSSRMPAMMHPSPRGPPHHRGSHVPPPHYMGHPYMGPPPVGYSPMGMPMAGGYPHPPHMSGEPPHSMYPPPPHSVPQSASRTNEKKRKAVTPSASTPKTPAVRVKFDPASSRKKRKILPGESEPTVPFFGHKFPEQPKTTSLSIFSFLSNDDLYNAGLVCRSWSQLAMDGELWKFQT